MSAAASHRPEGDEHDFTVVICTRDRPDHVLATLDALDAQTERAHRTLIVDQSARPHDALAARVDGDELVELLLDDGRGLSRARNLAWARVTTPWVVYLDDDCRPEPTWEVELSHVLREHDDVGFVSGHVSGEARPAGGDYLEVTAFPVHDEQVRAGRWTRPWLIGFGVCMAVRRTDIEQLGGWDERLGVGSEQGFPAGEDMDFNYRFLRAGGRALATPRVRASHEQWRSTAELAPLYERYMAGWCGFAMKHLRSGDPLGGLWLWSLGLLDLSRMTASALRRRSTFRAAVARAKLRGLVRGTWQGVRFPW